MAAPASAPAQLDGRLGMGALVLIQGGFQLAVDARHGWGAGRPPRGGVNRGTT